MDKDVRVKLEHIRDQIDELLNERELQYIGTFYGEQGKYELYLFPKSTEKYCDWYDAKQYCESLGGELPTIEELQYIDDNELDQTFGYKIYWSSINHNSEKTYKFSFINGSVSDYNKHISGYVRPVKRIHV